MLLVEAVLLQPANATRRLSLETRGAIIVLISWAVRCLSVLPPEAQYTALGTQFGSVVSNFALPAVIAFVCTAGIVLLTHSADSRGRQEMALTAMTGMMLSGVYGMLGLWLLSKIDLMAVHDASKMFTSDASLRLFFFLLLAAVANIFGVMQLIDVAFLCTPSYSRRLLAFTAAGLSGGFLRYRWLSVIGFVVHLRGLTAAQRKRLAAGRFPDVPEHVVGAQALWDRFALILSTVCWVLTLRPTQAICSWLMPPDLRVYACDWPIFNLGNDVALGVAAYYGKRNAKGRVAGKPRHFVCNVGQIDVGSSVAKSLPDVQRTMNTLADVWREFSERDVKGLVANVICMFPHVNGQRLMKQINLSAWESEQDAYEWYAKSPGHQRIIQNHSSGALQAFGNLLTSTQPTAPIRYQDRCQHCARVVESSKLGSCAPLQCDLCGGKTFQFPSF
jgi:hypothetical protein